MTKVNHPLHIVLSILTGGLWLIPYVFILANQGSRDRRNTQYYQRFVATQAATAEATRLAQQKQGESIARWRAEQG